MSDLYKKGRKTRFGNNLVIPESFNECLTYGEQLIWIFLHKQNTLVEGDNITLTRNADGTYTISSEAAGSTYEIVETTPSAGNVQAYKLVDIATGEQSGETIEIPAGGSSLPEAGNRDDLLQKTGPNEDDVAWASPNGMYPRMENSEGVEVWIERFLITDQAHVFGYEVSIETIDEGVYQITLTNPTTETITARFYWNARCGGYGDLSISTEATGISEYDDYGAYFDDLWAGSNDHNWLNMYISTELEAGASCSMTVTVTAENEFSGFDGIFDFDYTYSVQTLNVNRALEADNGVPLGGFDDAVLIASEVPGFPGQIAPTWATPSYPTLMPEDTDGKSSWVTRQYLGNLLAEGVEYSAEYTEYNSQLAMTLRNTGEEVASINSVLLFPCSGTAGGTLAVAIDKNISDFTVSEQVLNNGYVYEWLEVTLSGDIPAGESLEVTLTFEASGVSTFDAVFDCLHTYSRSPIKSENGIPNGGTTGQVLKKRSANSYDVEWGSSAGVNCIATLGPYVSSGQVSNIATGISSINKDLTVLRYMIFTVSGDNQPRLLDISNVSVDFKFTTNATGFSLTASKINIFKLTCNTTTTEYALGNSFDQSASVVGRIIKNADIIKVSDGSIVCRGRVWIDFNNYKTFTIGIQGEATLALDPSTEYRVRMLG